MANIPLVKSKHMFPFAAVLRAQGVNVHQLLKMALLPLNCLDEPDMLIPVVCGGIFRELVAQKVGRPNISLDVTRHLELENLGDIGRGVLREPTVHASLHTFRKLATAETSNVTIELRPQASGDLWFGHRIQTHVGSDEWHTALYTISWMLKIIQRADPAWSPAEILMNSKAIPTHFEAIEILGSTARLQQKDTGFLVPASMLALPVSKNLWWEVISVLKRQVSCRPHLPRTMLIQSGK